VTFHDELGARLTSIALQGELHARRKNPTAAKAEIGSLALRVRQLINATDEVIWTTDPGNDSLPNVVEFVCDYIERFFSPRPASRIGSMFPRFAAGPHQIPGAPSYSVGRQETLNNAVRHSGARLLMVRLTLADGALDLTIADDGVGFDGG